MSGADHAQFTAADDLALAQAQRALARMDWRQLLRQVLCPARVHLKDQPWTDFGAMFFHPAPPAELAREIAEFTQACAIPPLICSDMESGPAGVVPGAIEFPSMAGCGVAGDEQLAFEMGRYAAISGRQLGFNWTLAPVVDLARDIDSPMVGLRAAGRTPEAVIPVVRGYLRGLQAHGMAATAKHFPGDGFNSLDQHVTTPVNRMTREEWFATYGKTFSAAIAAGVACVMPGHLGLSWACPVDPRAGVEPPATVSKRLLTGLLREELGFQGVIVSDAMGMGGVAGFMHPYEAYAAFLEAGGDCILFARYDQHFEHEMERCLRQGLLQEATLFERASRLLALKRRFGVLTAKSAPAPVVEPLSVTAAARAMTEASVVVVRDRPQLLPLTLPPQAKVLHVIVGNDLSEGSATISALGPALAGYGVEVETWSDPGPEKLFFTLRQRQHALVVFSLGNRPDYATNVIRLYGPLARNLMDGWMHLGVPVVFVQHGHPFHHLHYPAAMATVISTYGSTAHAIDLVAAGILGGRTLPFVPVAELA